MKNIVLILSILMLGCQGFCADPELPQQVIEIESSGAVAIFQKQPTTDKQQQVIKIKKSGGFLLVQINGKVKNTDNNQAAE